MGDRAVRKAADPGVVERIAGFLADNDYTRAWRDGVMVPVTAAERAMISDPKALRELAADAASYRIANEVKKPGEYLGTPLAKEFSELVGYPEDFDIGSQEGFDLPAGYRKGLAGNLSDSFQETSPEKAKAILEWAQQNPAARRPLTGPGAFVEATLGSPVAAYGLPAAGVGLAGWAAYDLLMAQQQAQKESQLPMSGSEQIV